MEYISIPKLQPVHLALPAPAPIPVYMSLPPISLMAVMPPLPSGELSLVEISTCWAAMKVIPIKQSSLVELQWEYLDLIAQEKKYHSLVLQVLGRQLIMR